MGSAPDPYSLAGCPAEYILDFLTGLARIIENATSHSPPIKSCPQRELEWRHCFVAQRLAVSGPMPLVGIEYYLLWIGAIGAAGFVVVTLIEGWVRGDCSSIRQPVSAPALSRRGWVQYRNFAVRRAWRSLLEVSASHSGCGVDPCAEHYGIRSREDLLCSPHGPEPGLVSRSSSE